MYILVVGCGKVGYHLAKALMAGDHEVLVIERDPSRVDHLEEEMGSIVLIGDGTEVGVLKEAGANRADTLIATTGSDGDNLVACQVAKYWFKIGRTVALVNNPNNQRLFRDLGVDVPVSSTEIIMKNIEEEIPTHPLVHLLNLDNSKLEMVVIRVPPESSVVGHALWEIQLPRGSQVSLVIRHSGDPRAPTEDLRIESEDEVICLTTPDEEGELLKTLTQVP